MTRTMDAQICRGADLEYVIKTPRGDEARERANIVIFFHSRGGSMFEFVDLADALDREGYVYVFPNAPFKDGREEPEGSAHAGHFTWQESPQDGGTAAAPGRRPGEVVASFVDEIIDRVGGHRAVIVGGFSQGGAFALGYGLGDSAKADGVVALSTYMPADLTAVPPGSPPRRCRRIFLAHGVDDPRLSIDVGRRSHSLLERDGHAVTYQEYPMKHELCFAEIRDLRSWLRRWYPAGVRS